MSDLYNKLREIRNRAIAKGMKLLSIDEIDELLGRGRPSESEQQDRRSLWREDSEWPFPTSSDTSMSSAPTDKGEVDENASART